jgi:hypothetical protein
MAALLFTLLGCSPASSRDRWPQYAGNPFVIRMSLPAPTDDRGSLFAADLDGDGLMDYLVTVPGHIAAYGHEGRELWSLETDIRLSLDEEKWGLPGQHAPGAQAGDVDADGAAEVLYFTQDNTLHVVAAATGRERWTARLPVPEGADRWEHVVIADFRGRGDRDLLFQTTNVKGYRMGRYLVAHAAETLAAGRNEPLWQKDDFLACAHNGVRVADLDGDGRDEVLGGMILSPEGRMLCKLPLTGHIDAIAVDDIRPDLPGLEVVAFEEGDMRFPDRDRVMMYNPGGLLWQNHRDHQEAQDAAIGDFDPGRPGLEVFCRHRGNGHQVPWMYDARGTKIAEFKLEQTIPAGWEPAGIEVVQTIEWTGGPRALIAAKERHKPGDIAIIEPMTGRFVQRYPEKALRLYVADVSGDWREEMVVLCGQELHIYHNPEPAAKSRPTRLWTLNQYRRGKMTWNYSSQ